MKKCFLPLEKVNDCITRRNYLPAVISLFLLSFAIQSQSLLAQTSKVAAGTNSLNTVSGNPLNSENKISNMETIKAFVKQSSDKIWFEVNQGQYPQEVQYAFKTSFGFMAVYKDKLRLFAVQQPAESNTNGKTSDVNSTKGFHSVDINFPGSTGNWSITPSRKSTTLGSYVIKHGQSISPDMFGEITLNNVYPGIDLRLYAAGDKMLEFDWVLKNSDDYNKIRMSMQGQKGLTIKEDGSLAINLQHQDLDFIIPQSYQVVNGQKKEVKANIAFAENANTLKYTFNENLISGEPLVIDPSFSWSTFFDANSGSFDNYAYAVSANLNGVYVTGVTNALPPQSYMSNVAAGYSNTLNSGFITYRLNLSGTAITAWTMSNASLSNASFSSTFVGDNDLFPDGRLGVIYSNGDLEIFTANLANEVLYSASPGGVNFNEGSAIVAETDSTFYLGGNVTANVAGVSIGPDAARVGTTEGFICRYNINGASLIADWGTYVGGDGAEGLMFLSLTPDKTKLVFGIQSGSSSNVPTLVNAVDATFAGTSEALVGVLPSQTAKPSAFSVLSWLGGSGTENFPFVTSTNSYFFVGFETSSTNLPSTAGAFQTTNGTGATDLAVARIPLNGSLGSGFICSYLGGTGDEQLAGIVYNDRDDEIALFGSSQSGSSGGGFPTVNTTPASAVYQSANAGGLDMIYAVVTPDLTTKKYATFIGGSFNDYFGSTGTIRGQGTFNFSPITGQIYAATTTHSAPTGTGALPAAFFSDLPGFDKTRANAASNTADVHLIFACNTNSYDHGDAPASYENGNPAKEAVDQATIHIGVAVDAESVAPNSALANGDDILNSGSADDEDGVLSSEPLHFDASASTYSLIVNTFNHTGSAVTLWGWIDFNKNGTFEASEAASVSVPNSVNQQNATLNWSGFSVTTGQSFIRLRISTATLTSTSATGTGATGEIEDYPLYFCTMSAAASGTNVNCFGNATGTATVLVTGGTAAFTYAWSNAATTAAISNLLANTYSITVTDSKGCQATSSYQVTQPNAALTAVATGTNVNCKGNSTGTASVTANNGTPGYTYLWSNAQTTSAISGLSAGTYTVTVTDSKGCTKTASYQVTEPLNALSLTVTPTDPTCPGGGSNGSACANASGGTASYTYAWSTSATTQCINGLPAGSYTVTVTDAKGCTKTDSKTLTLPASPTPSISGTLAFCSGSSTQLCATAGFAGYSWSTGATTQCITVSTQGTFTVTVTDANGCKGSDHATTIVNTNPTPVIKGPFSFCAGSSTQLCAPLGFDNYSWSTGATTQCITASTAGTFTVTVTDANGCSGSTSASTTVNQNPTPSITGSRSFCAGSSSQLCAPAGFNYLWNTGATSQCITVSTANTFSVTVTDQNGCSGSASATTTVNQNPTPSITGDRSFCAGSSTQLCAPAGFNYLWNTGATTQCITVSTANTFSVTVTDQNGCSGSTSATTTVNQNPTPSITGDRSFCAGSSTQLCAPDGFNYLWNTGATTQCITVSTANTFSVTVTDQNGCSGSTSATTTVNQNPTPSITGDRSFCEGSSTQLCAPAGFTYSWSTGATTQCITVSTANTFTVTVTDQNGCSGSTSATTTVNQNPTPSITGDRSFCAGSSTQLCAPAGFTYSWSTGATTQCITVSTANTFSVTVTDQNGCSGSASATTTVNQNPTPSITGDRSFCAGSSTQLCAPAGFNYLWNTGATTQCITVSTANTFSVTVTDQNGCSGSTSATTTVNQNPTPSITGDRSFCAGSSTQLCAPDGFNYLWNTGATTQCITVSTANTFTVTVTDQNGCSGSTSATTTVNQNPTPSITGDRSFCAGSSTQLCAPAGFTYSWSTGATTQCITVSTANTFTVTVTDQNGCSGSTSATTTVNQNPTPSITGDRSFCAGSSTQLCAPAGFTYSWSTGATSQCITVSTASTFTVTVTDQNGCSGSAFATTTINQNPTPSISGDRSFCAGSSTQLCAPDGFDSYVWSTGATTQCITVSIAGTFTVTVTNANGCSGSGQATTTVNQNPTPSITGDRSFCAGSSSQLCAPDGFNYLWNTGATTQCITVSTANTFTVTVTDQNGCSGSTSATTTVNQNPTPSITGDRSFCAGSSTQLCAPAGFTYSWSTGATTQCITVSTANTFSVTVTDQNGCSGTTSATTTVNQNPTPSITGDRSFCSGSSTQLCAPAGFNYLWNTGATTQCITVSIASTFSVTVTDQNGCSGSTFATTTINQNPTPSISGDRSFCAGSSTQLCAPDGFDSYVWSTGATTQCISVSIAGTFTVTVTNGNGCSGSGQATTTVNQNPTPSISGDRSFCAGSSSQLCAPAGFNYLWNTGATSQCITVSTANTFSVTVTDQNGCSGSTSATTTVNQNPTPSITGDRSFCAGSSSQLCAPAGFTYSWSTGATTQCITVSTANTFSVTVTDQNGCSGTTSATTTVNQNPTPSINGTLAFCSGSSTQLCAPGGYAGYLWSTGATSECITVSTEGTFTVTVTDQNGCSGSDHVTTTVNSNPTAPISGSRSFCAGSSTQLCAPDGFESYTWSTGASTQCITVSIAGTFTVTVTNANGCSGSGQATTTINQNPTPSIFGNNLFCPGSSIQLCATAEYSGYSWSTGATTQCITVSSMGTFTVTVTDANGCNGSDHVTTVQDTTRPFIVCPGDVVVNCDASHEPAQTGTATATDNITLNPVITHQDEILPGSCAGNYTIQRTWTATDNCLNSASCTQTITVQDLTPPSIGNPGRDTILNCPASLAFTAPTASDNCSGVHVVEVSDISAPGSCPGTYSETKTWKAVDSCGNESGLVHQTITTVDNTAPEISCSPNKTLTCYTGESVTFDTPQYSDACDQNPSLTVISTDTIYNLNGSVTYKRTWEAKDACQNANQCSQSITVPAQFIPTITPDGSTIICSGDSVQLCASAGNGYSWSTGKTTSCIWVSSTGSYTVTVTDENNCTGTASIDVFARSCEGPPCLIAGDTSICHGQSTTLSVPAGSASYLWSNGATTNSITVNCTGNYCVTVTESNGTFRQCCAHVTVHPLPPCCISGNNRICQGQSTQLCAPAGQASYTWSTGATTSCITVSAAGTYTVTVTNASGCHSTCSICVSTYAVPSCTISGNSNICQGQCSALCAPSGAAGYQWSTGATTRCINVNSSGTYTVTVTNFNGCSSTCSKTVTVSPVPSCNITLNGGNLNTLCQGQSGQLCAPAGYASYVWSTGATTQCITITASGNYAVTVTNSGGCSSSCCKTINVNCVPSCSISTGGCNNNTTFCQGQSAQLCAPAGNSSYSWSNGATTQCINVTASGTYTVTVTNSSGCSSSCSKTVTVSQPPSCTITGNNSFCQGGSTQLCAPAGQANYLWSTGATSQCINVNCAGTYTVTVTNGSGCSSTCNRVITVNPVPNCQITVTGNTNFCQGQNSAQLCAPTGYASYAWSNGATTQCITVTAAGNYTVTVTNSSGCSSSCSKSLASGSIPSCSITVGGCHNNNNLCQGQTAQLCAPSGYASYVWNTGATTQCINVASSGTYTVTVTNAGGCSSTCNQSVIVNQPPSCSITGNASFCQGGSTQLCAPAGQASYSWCNGATTQCINVTSSGTYTVTVTNASGCSSSCSQTVTVSQPPTCIITGNASFCQGGSSQLCAPAGQVSYAWSTGETTQCISVSTGGAYSVTVTNANGCSSTGSKTISVSQPPSCTITGNTSCCQGGSTQLCAPGGQASYSWSTGATTQCIHVSASGTYSVTVTSTSGCSSTCSKTITVSQPPSCTITGNASFCQGGSTQLCAPAGQASYSWNTGATTQCINVSVAGTYTVTVTNGSGCSSTCNTVIVSNPIPSCQITASGNTNFCQGETSAQLCAPAGYASYVWSTGATTQCISVTTAGNYTVTVTNSSGCSSSCSRSLTAGSVPNCTISVTGCSNNSMCQGQTAQLCAASGYASYVWSTGATTQCIHVSSSGTYSVTVTNAGGCSSTCSQIIEISQAPSCNISGNTSICQGNSTQLCAPAGQASYSWSTGATTRCITVASAGTYSVTVTNNSGCSSTCSACVTVRNTSHNRSYISGCTSICQGQSSTLCAPSGCGSYVWNNGATTRCISIHCAGTYTVTVTNSSGCSSTSSVHVSQSTPPSCQITGNTSLCIGHSTTLCVPSCGSSYRWNTGATTRCISVSCAGTYTVTVTNSAGCSSSCSVCVTATTNCHNGCGLRTVSENSLDESSALYETRAYPNPFSSTTTIQFQNKGTGAHTVVEIYGLTGAKIAEVFNNETESGQLYKVDWNAEGLPAGLYMYRIICGDKVETGRLMLER